MGLIWRQFAESYLLLQRNLAKEDDLRETFCKYPEIWPRHSLERWSYHPKIL